MATEQSRAVTPPPPPPVCAFPSFAMVNGHPPHHHHHGLPPGILPPPPPPFMPTAFMDRAQSPSNQQQHALVNFAAAHYPHHQYSSWTTPFQSPWPFRYENAQNRQHHPPPPPPFPNFPNLNLNVNYMGNNNHNVNDHYGQHHHQQQTPPIEWYEYEVSSHSYDFYDPENGEQLNENLVSPLPRSVSSACWLDWQEWAFDMRAEDDDDFGYPSKRLQRIAWDSFRSTRARSFLESRIDADAWQRIINERIQELIKSATMSMPGAAAVEKRSPKNENEDDDEPNNEDEPNDDDDAEESIKPDEEPGIRITIPDTLPPIPCCETLLIPYESTEANSNSNANANANAVGAPSAPISYASVSTPRNAAETIAAYMNRMVKLQLLAANTPVNDPYPLRHQRKEPTMFGAYRTAAATIPTPINPDMISTTTGAMNGESVSTSSALILPQQQLNSLDAMALMARKNSFAFRQLNGGLLLIAYPHDEHRYCIGSSTAGRMVVGLEKLSPPRLYANDFRTICLKKVPYSEDCDKVWCRLNLFRKQIGAEKSTARKNNVAIYEMFAKADQFAYFGRIPYKWNLDEYLKSEYYSSTIVNVEKEGLRILRGIVNGLAYVHRGDFRLFHGNLKPSNVLVSSDGTIFLTDYGFGRICCPMWSGAAAHRFCRDTDTGVFDPLCWKAHEFFSGCGAGALALQQNVHAVASPSFARETPHRQADVFSSALLGYFAVTGGHSHPLIDGDEAYRKTLHFYRQRVDRFADFVRLDRVSEPCARRLIGSMLEIDVKQRPDARYVADHPSFWSEKKRNEFLVAMAEFVCASEKSLTSAIASHSQSTMIVRTLMAKKVASLGFARRLNSTPDHIAKLAVRFGCKFDDANLITAVKTYYRHSRRSASTSMGNGNGNEKMGGGGHVVGNGSSAFDNEFEALWNELVSEIYDAIYPSPPLKLKHFFTK